MKGKRKRIRIGEGKVFQVRKRAVQGERGEETRHSHLCLLDWLTQAGRRYRKDAQRSSSGWHFPLDREHH